MLAVSVVPVNFPAFPGWAHAKEIAMAADKLLDKGSSMIWSPIAHGLLDLKYQGPFFNTTRDRRKSMLRINIRSSMDGFPAMPTEVWK
jgi:hypothetical protein